MPFLAYVAIILVSLGGILFELNWLTSPKLDTKAAVQASTAAPAKLAEATPAKSEAPIAPRSETAPPRNVAPTVTMVPAAPTAPPIAGQAQASEPAAAEPAPQQAAAAPVAAPAVSATVSAPAVAPLAPAPTTTGVASTDFKREFTTDPKPAASVNATVTPVATTNKCDVAACSAAYQSFRASDCTFQPMEGPRKVCDRAPDATQRAAAPARDARVETATRKPGRDAELRAVERTVRRLTAEEADLDRDIGRSEVIMIDRRDW